jgi:hypothetical protein
MLEIIRYTKDYKNDWDSLVNCSRNGTFLILRDYVDYHADRFTDCSYLFFRNGKVEAVIAGNIDHNCYFSHQGLTYGGIVSSPNIGTQDVVMMFKLLNEELKKTGISEIVYKPVPLIYHRIPAQEDLYALFLNKGEKIGCSISSAIFQNSKLRFIELRRRGIRKSKKELVEIIQSQNLTIFWKILERNLVHKFNTRPAHSIQEIESLSNRFPENIKLYTAEYKGVIIGGTVLYLMKNVVHVQYISATKTGKAIGALDLLFDYLINEEYRHIPVFDFGHSTEKMGNYLNKNLIFQKEGFGGRGVVYETYKYNPY